MNEIENKYHPVEQPNEIPTRDKEDAMGAYLMMFGALAAGLPLPIINLIAAIVYYVVNAKKSRFIKFHSLQSLLSQTPTTLMNAGLLYWTIHTLFAQGVNDEFIFDGLAQMGDLYWGYLWTVVAANLLYVIFSIVGAIKARKGQFYYFMFFGKLSYHYAYRVKDSDHYQNEVTNQPPV
jgi:uncharacterized Tic20 family protein